MKIPQDSHILKLICLFKKELKTFRLNFKYLIALMEINKARLNYKILVIHKIFELLYTIKTILLIT